MKFANVGIIATLILGTHFNVSANLIVNGGFEDTKVKANSWQWFTADTINGWDGSNIEIWNNYLGVTATEGQQFAELNSHANGGSIFSIFQTFSTEIDSIYDFSFAYRARVNTNESFSISLGSNNDNFFSRVLDDHIMSTWNTMEDSFTAISTSTTIRFTSITPATSTLGNFLDDIKVVKRRNLDLASTAVSEPAIGTLFGLSLMVIMGLTRKKRAKNQSSN
ncbi:DUF642 domain-containing protein [Paraglaciecola sp.]|uniref:DUF642 domain-containing protein n=1 Tax=Paraglaciecola sp. TaxID=1920173 RepID=UPI0030F41FD2